MVSPRGTGVVTDAPVPPCLSGQQEARDQEGAGDEKLERTTVPIRINLE
jgi:hypothetical protein